MAIRKSVWENLWIVGETIFLVNPTLCQNGLIQESPFTLKPKDNSYVYPLAYCSFYRFKANPSHRLELVLGRIASYVGPIDCNDFLKEMTKG